MDVLSALFPVFVVILLGWVLRRIRFPGDGFWAPAERITYFILFPALLVRVLTHADITGFSAPGLIVALAAAITGLGAAAMGSGLRLGVDGPAVTSLFQGVVRFNTYVFLPTASALFGPRGLAIGAICVAFMVPLINVYCVLVLLRLGRHARRMRIGELLGALFRNPLILACAAGLLLNLSGIGLGPVLARSLDILGRAALPIGLLAVGAALDPRAARRSGLVVVAAALLRLLALPVAGALLLQAFGVSGLPRAVGVLWCAMPTATSAYILARQLGGDASLMAAITTVSHVAALVTLPLVVWLLT